MRFQFHAPNDIAKAAFEAGDMRKAKAYASESLELASQFKGDGMYGTAVHQGNLILGRLALKEGDTEKAKAYLIKAGQTPGGGTLSLFGPNMALAKELLERGEKDAVLEYLELCKKFWDTGGGRQKLSGWMKTIKVGGIPEFGENLIY